MNITEISKEDLMTLLCNKDITIGQGTYGLLKQIDDNTLIKIYYKKKINTYLSLNEQTLDKEISDNKEIEELTKNQIHDELRSKKLLKLHELSLVKGIVLYEKYEIGVLLNYYKDYEELSKVFGNFLFNERKEILSRIKYELETLMKNNIYPQDLKESNIMISLKDLDIKIIDLDDDETRYEDIDYILQYPHIKNNCINRYNEMKKRLLRQI